MRKEVDRDRIELFATLPPCRSWLDTGASFASEAHSGRLPTFTRATTKRRPPHKPAGVASRKESEHARWVADDFA